MRRFLLSTLLATLCTIAFAQDETSKKKLGVYASVDVLSESIWHGWDLSSNKPALVPYVAIDLWGTGFETAFWATKNLDRDYKSNDDYEFMLKYNNNITTGLLKEINFHGFVDYIRVPNQTLPIIQEIGTDNTSTIDGKKRLWKMNLGFSFNNLISCGEYNIVPAYNLYYIAPANGALLKSGTIHDFSLSYSRPLCKRVNWGLSTNAFYHYHIFGVDAWGGVVGSTTLSFKINESLSFNTQLHYQETLSESVNSDNEFWGGAGLSISL
jgi:hypothetical protein